MEWQPVCGCHSNGHLGQLKFYSKFAENTITIIVLLKKSCHQAPAAAAASQSATFIYRKTCSEIWSSQEKPVQFSKNPSLKAPSRLCKYCWTNNRKKPEHAVSSFRSIKNSIV